MRLILALLFASTLSAQTVQITVKQGSISKAWSILLRPKVTLSAFTCAAAEMEPGESTVCTVTLNQPARALGVEVTVVLPTGFTGPASVTVPAGSASATFSLTRLDVIAAGPRVFPVAWSIHIPGCAPQRFAEVLTACCARADRCGLPDAEIAWGPCIG
jgi:hypothetical protein